MYCRSWPFLASKRTKLRFLSCRVPNVICSKSCQQHLCCWRWSLWICSRNWNHAIITVCFHSLINIIWYRVPIIFDLRTIFSWNYSTLDITTVAICAERFVNSFITPIFSTSVQSSAKTTALSISPLLLSVLSGLSTVSSPLSKSLSFMSSSS